MCLIYLSGFRFQLLHRIFSARITEPVSSQYLSPRKYQDLIFIRVFYIVHTQKTQSLVPFLLFLNILILVLAALQQFMWTESLYWMIQIALHSCLIFITAHYPPTLLILVSSVLFIWILSSSSCNITQQWLSFTSAPHFIFFPGVFPFWSSVTTTAQRDQRAWHTFPKITLESHRDHLPKDHQTETRTQRARPPLLTHSSDNPRGAGVFSCCKGVFMGVTHYRSTATVCSVDLGNYPTIDFMDKASRPCFSHHPHAVKTLFSREPEQRIFCCCCSSVFIFLLFLINCLGNLKTDSWTNSNIFRCGIGQTTEFPQPLSKFKESLKYHSCMSFARMWINANIW